MRKAISINSRFQIPLIILLIMISLFFVGLPVSAAVFPVPEHFQEQDQWCWAGVSACVLDYYGAATPQCEIAEYTRQVATWHDYGSVDCCVDTTQGCNYANYNWGFDGSIQDILQHFGGINNNGAAKLTQEQCATEIAAYEPFIPRWAWDSGGGHFIVAHGIDPDGTFYYMNPWFGEGLKISTYDWVSVGGGHTWTSNNVISTSPCECFTNDTCCDGCFAQNQGTTCNADNNGCTVNDICNHGICVAGSGPNCSSQDDICNTGTCSSTGISSYVCVKNPTPNESDPCDADSDGCTVNDHCESGSCAAGSAPNCTGQSDSCNTGVCSSTGNSSYKCIKDPTPHEGNPCDADSDGCTVGDTCSSGVCVAGSAPDCSGQSDVCNTGVCNSTSYDTYKCVKDPTTHNGTSCNADSDGCTAGDMCSGGTCTAGIAPNCSSQSDACNTGVCFSTGINSFKCVKDPTPHNGESCNADSYGCTVGDACDDGVCAAGPEADCSGQSDQCNTGVCNSTGVGSFQCIKSFSSHEGTACNADDNGCTVNDTCHSGVCQSGSSPDCSGESDQCNTGICNSTSSTSFACIKNSAPHEGVDCNADDDGCTVGDTCAAGACVVGSAPDCTSETDQCNKGVCESTGNASFQCVKDPAPHDGYACNADRDGCTVGDVCNGGTCVPGPEPDCSDQTDQCNSGVCNSTGSLSYVCLKDPVPHEGNNCNADSDGCTVGDRCLAGICTAGPVPDCSAKNDVCNTGVCDSIGDDSYYCIKDPEPHENQSCDDGLVCTANDSCISGLCTGEAVGCDDGLACTSNSCNPEDGSCLNEPRDTLCDDANPCTVAHCDVIEGCVSENVDDWFPCEMEGQDSTSCFTGICQPTAANDRCTGATPLNLGEEIDVSFEGAHQSPDAGVVCEPDGPVGVDLFFQVEIQSGISYRIQATPANGLDIAVAAWGGCEEPECLGWQNDGSSGEVEFFESSPIPQGGTIIIQVIGLESDVDAFGSTFSLIVEEVDTADGDTEDDIDGDLDGDTDGDIDGDIDGDTDGDEGIPDGDTTDSDQSESDRDDDLDFGVPETDGDLSEASDDGESLGDSPATGGSVGGGCQSTHSAANFLVLMILLIVVGRKRSTN